MKSGCGRVFQNISNTWTQIGDDIEGKAAYDFFGSDIALSSDGTIVAIGANRNRVDLGYTSVFQNISNTWTQIGDDQSGCSVALNSDGTRVAIGTFMNDENGTNAGRACIFQNISNVWTQIDVNIYGEAAGDYFGTSIALSSDGNIVAIGAPNNDENGYNSGHVRVYKNYTKVTKISLISII